MPWGDILIFLFDWAVDGSKHFSLALLLGLLGYVLTLTIFYVPYSIFHRLIHRQESTVVAYGILICSLLLGVFLALISHALLDHLEYWYYAPLGPHLELFH